MRAVLILSLITLCLFPTPLVWADRGIKKINKPEDLTHANNSIGTYRALIIGINDYQDDQIPDLKTAKNDALAMADLLKKRYGFKINSKDILLDRKATRAAIYNALRKLAATAAPSDSVLIYYAGHGDLDEVFNAGWWIPSDAKAGDASSYLDNVQVQTAMSSMQARHALLISDSCYSGTLFGKSRAIPKVITDKYYLGLFNEKSRWGMTSGNKTPVSDSGTKDHSVFAYQLLKELNNNEKPYISAQEVYSSIAPIISNNSDQTPMCNPIKHTGDQGGRFIFIASSGAVIDAPVEPTRHSKTLLSVSANISGAKVYVDGDYVGSTNLIDKVVTPGRHRVRVEKEGYQPYSRQLVFKQGREKSLQAILDPEAPSTGSLYIHTEPSDATIRILNIGPKFSQGMELSPGKYHVEVSASGHATRKKWVELSSGEDKDLDIRLKPLASASPRNNNVSSAQPTPPAPSSGAVSGETFTNRLGMNFVKIEPGTFMMGSPVNEADREYDETQHQVTLTRGYYLQTTEVTQGQWQTVMGNNPSKFESCGEDCPVESVSWKEVQAFIQKLNQQERDYQYRLPTEAEWEYAARAGTTTPFSFGNTLRKDQANYDSERTTQVKSFPPNAWGLYDMHGNVWEWCQDRYGDYPSGSVTDPQGPSSDDYRVLRGGSWRVNAGYCRSASRGWDAPGDRRNDYGFRLVAPLVSR